MGMGSGYHTMVSRLVIPVIKYAKSAGMLSLAHRATGAGGRAPSCDRGSAVAHAKAPEKTGDVLLGRGGPYADPSGYLLVRRARRDQLDDLTLPGRELHRSRDPRSSPDRSKPRADRLPAVRRLSAHYGGDRCSQRLHRDVRREITIDAFLDGRERCACGGVLSKDQGWNTIQRPRRPVHRVSCRFMQNDERRRGNIEASIESSDAANPQLRRGIL